MLAKIVVHHPLLASFIFISESLAYFRPILVLPPAEIQVVYCELTEAEQDFYEALFKRSKVYNCFDDCISCEFIGLSLLLPIELFTNLSMIKNH